MYQKLVKMIQSSEIDDKRPIMKYLNDNIFDIVEMYSTEEEAFNFLKSLDLNNSSVL